MLNLYINYKPFDKCNTKYIKCYSFSFARKMQEQFVLK